jgi:predicted dehydrogenase
MRVIFLDFDGVLNSDSFFRANDGRYVPGALDPGAVARLTALVARTGAKVVIASTWRLDYTLERIREILAKHGFVGEVIGVTPSIQRVDEDEGCIVRHGPRGLEIQAWIDAQPEPVEAFVILDDQRDMEHLLPRLVCTDFATGLLDAHVEDAFARLSGG